VIDYQWEMALNIILDVSFDSRAEKEYGESLRRYKYGDIYIKL
jgi:hypothetical protein